MTRGQSLNCSAGWKYFGVVSNSDPAELEQAWLTLDVGPETLGYEPAAEQPRPSDWPAPGLEFAGEPPRFGRHATGGAWLYGFEVRLCTDVSRMYSLTAADFELKMSDGSWALNLSSDTHLGGRVVGSPFDADSAAPTWLADRSRWILETPPEEVTCRVGWTIFSSSVAADPVRLTLDNRTSLDVSPAHLGYEPVMAPAPPDPYTLEAGRPYPSAELQPWLIGGDSAMPESWTSSSFDRALQAATAQVVTLTGEPYVVAMVTPPRVDRQTDRVWFSILGQLAGGHGWDSWHFTCARDGTDVTLDVGRAHDPEEPLFAAIPSNVAEAADAIIAQDEDAQKVLARGSGDYARIYSWYPERPGVISVTFIDHGIGALPAGSVVARDGGPALATIYVSLPQRRVVDSGVA